MKTEVSQTVTVMSRGRIGKPKKSAVELAGNVRMPDTTRRILSRSAWSQERKQDSLFSRKPDIARLLIRSHSRENMIVASRLRIFWENPQLFPFLTYSMFDATRQETIQDCSYNNNYVRSRNVKDYQIFNIDSHRNRPMSDWQRIDHDSHQRTIICKMWEREREGGCSLEHQVTLKSDEFASRNVNEIINALACPPSGSPREMISKEFFSRIETIKGRLEILSDSSIKGISLVKRSPCRLRRNTD